MAIASGGGGDRSRRKVTAFFGMWGVPQCFQKEERDTSCANLNWLAGFRLDSDGKAGLPSPMHLETIARVGELFRLTHDC